MLIKGKNASDGIGIAKVYKISSPNIVIVKRPLDDGEEEKEVKKFRKAVADSIKELQDLKQVTLETIGAKNAEIFDAHILILEDETLVDQTVSLIEEQKYNASYAFDETSKNIVAIFATIDDEYMRERVQDIKDVSKRVLYHIKGYKIPNLATLNEDVIIVANDLTPSETAQINKKYVKGFVTNVGGRTSHSAIMARSMEIPAVTGTNKITTLAFDGDMMIVDGSQGNVILNPSKEEIELYSRRLSCINAQKDELMAIVNQSSITSDNHQIYLEANIGSVTDVDLAIKNGCEGIGLFRSEFLYMNSDTMPAEDIQFNAYKTVLEKLNGKTVIIRTLDIGGDKELSYLPMEKELNPFLGNRAIRLCLDRQDIFRTQLRALLRASVYGDLAIMFPMIATIEEFNQAKRLLMAEKKELIKTGVKVSDNIKIGMMIEIPAAVLNADNFAKYSDFFSIGTNDLIQYSMAADRGNEKVSYLYQPTNPSILRLIKMTIDSGHKYNRQVGMCGEVAGDINALPLLIGMGLDCFSMSASSILKTRSIVSKLSYEECKKLVEKCLECETSNEIINLVQLFYKDLNINIC